MFYYSRQKKKKHRQLPKATEEHRSESCKHLGKSTGKKAKCWQYQGLLLLLAKNIVGYHLKYIATGFI